MKKIYLQPEMELTEYVMMRASICQSPAPQNPTDPWDAPARKVF